MLLTDKAKAILMIVLEVLFTIGLIAGGVCVAILVPDVEIKIVSLVFVSLLIAMSGVLIGATVFLYINEFYEV